MAWVRPKHKPKVEVDPTEALRPVLEYFSCSRPSAPTSNNKVLARIPKKPLLLLESYEPRPQKRQHEEPEHHERPDQHLHQQRAEHHSRAARQPRAEHHHRAEPRLTADQHSFDYDRTDYHERASQRTTSRYTREISPPPPTLPSYRSSARSGSYLRPGPSRRHLASDVSTSRRPASRWASATTALEL